MTKEQFIEKIAPIIVKYAPKYNVLCPSAVIAQAVLESDGGNSELAVKAPHNYFGLKYRVGRCPTASGIYYKVGSEQNADGSYSSSAMQWMSFKTMEDGVIGYFDFTNISNYSSIKGVSDPRTYLENIKKSGYATSLKYVDNLMAVINSYNLTKYDPAKSSTNKVVNTSTTGNVGKTIKDEFLNEVIHNMKIDSSYKCNAANYSSTNGRTIKYVVIHYTGNSKDKAINNAKYFQGAGRNASAHFFVDDESFYQSVALKDKAWHCGASSYKHNECRNANSIGIEMCCTEGNYRVSQKTQENTAYLCARLCKLIGINASQVDKYVLTHNFVTGKKCPRQYADNPNEFTAFKQMVRDILTKGIVIGKITNSTSSSTSSNTTTKVVPTKITQAKSSVQMFLNEYYGNEIKSVHKKLLAVDGDLGAKSKQGIAIAMQTELNRLGANLKIDGDFGTSTTSAFTKHVGTLKNGSKGIFVTLWQCLLLAYGFNPNGIDGIMGNGCVKATNELFEKYGLSKDSVVTGTDINALL